MKQITTCSTVKSRLGELRASGIELKVLHKETIIADRGREVVIYRDGKECSATDKGRREFRPGKEGYDTMRMVLEREGVKPKNGNPIRVSVYTIYTNGGKRYRFHYPEEQYFPDLAT